MILLTVNQAERYFCPYREGNCVPHECMAWKYLDEKGHCQMFEDSEPTIEPIKQKNTISFHINGYIFTLTKPEISIRVVKSDEFVQIWSDEHQEAIINRSEWDARGKNQC